MLVLALTGPKKLEVLQVDEPGRLEEGELLVCMEYSCVQPLDSQLAAAGPGPEGPQVMGTEGVGRVLQSRCPGISAGSRVGFVFHRVPGDFGCWCSTVTLSRARACIAEIPPDVAPQDAAAGLASTLTAVACLRHFDRGAVVVVPGACGAVGLALLQLAVVRGMRAIGLVRGTARTAWIAQELGAGGAVHAADVSAPSWPRLAAELCEASTEGDCGADGVIDGVGGELLPQLLESGVVRRRGVIVTYGSINGKPDEARVAAATKLYGLQRYSEGVQSALSRPDALAQLRDALALMASGKYRPRVWQSVKWSDAGHCLVPQPSWSKHISQFTEGRIGRILLKFH